MNTITLYLDGRARARRTKSLLAGGIFAIAALALADRPGAAPEEEKVRVVTTTVTTTVTETVLQIERVPANCETVGPPETSSSGPSGSSGSLTGGGGPTLRSSEVLRGTRGARPRRPRPPTVSPSRLSFLSPGWEPVAIINPYNVPIRIRHIAIRGEARREFEIIGTAQCIGTLRPGERCRFSVFGRPAQQRSDQAGSDAAMRIEIHHDADSKPLVILAATGG